MYPWKKEKKKKKKKGSGVPWRDKLFDDIADDGHETASMLVLASKFPGPTPSIPISDPGVIVLLCYLPVVPLHKDFPFLFFSFSRSW